MTRPVVSEIRRNGNPISGRVEAAGEGSRTPAREVIAHAGGPLGTEMLWRAAPARAAVPATTPQPQLALAA